MPVISTNTASNSANRCLSINSSAQSSSVSKIAGGSRITSASDDGTLQAQIDDLNDLDDTPTTKSDTIKANTETYRSRLTNYHAEFEAKAETAKLQLQYLNYDDSSDDS